MDEKMNLRADGQSQKKKSKKAKKEKKQKKSKKNKKQSRDTSSSSSSSDSEGFGSEWVEKIPGQRPSKDDAEASSSRSDVPARDEWMTAPCMFACVTRDQIRAAKQPTEKKKEEEAAKYMLDRPGQSARELNPYWADGGTGLPSEQPPEPESLSLNSTTVGDQGVTWLRRALQRAKEQAEESGQSLEEVAAERWGSLQKLEELVSEAEGRQISLRHGTYNDKRRGSNTENRHGRSPSDYGKVDRKDDYKKPGDRRDGPDRGYYPGERDRKEDLRKKPNFARPDEESYSRHRFKRGTSFGEDSGANIWKSSGNSLSHDDESYDKYRQSTLEGRSRLSFKKPGENYEESSSLSGYKHRQSSSGSRSWRKKDIISTPDVSKTEESTETKREKSTPSSGSIPKLELDTPPEIKLSEQPEILSDQQMNELAAKLVKAEILGNEDLVTQLKKKLDLARERRSINPEAIPTSSKLKKSEEEVVVLSRTDSKGFARPLETKSAHPEPVGGRRKKEKAETHGADGQRVRYFPDDDKYSLQDMFQREKLTTVEDQNEMFTKLAGKDGRQEHDFDMDDIFSERARQKNSDGKMEARERGRAIQEHKRKERMLDSCKWCFDGKDLQRHLIVAVGAKSYVCLPPYQSLTEGHCLIIPLHHTTCATQLDEDVWEEIQDFRKALVRMFAADDEDCVLFESAMFLNKFPHMVLHCVPLPQEMGDMAPIYFKKAILECETEWSTNKKLVDLSKKDVRHSVPKGLPYFAVDFGNDGGFAHVIEEEKYFPTNFAQEIIGGMLDLDHSTWRKPKLENFDKQRRKAVDFSKKWRDFDFTKKTNQAKRLKTENYSSSDS